MTLIQNLIIRLTAELVYEHLWNSLKCIWPLKSIFGYELTGISGVLCAGELFGEYGWDTTWSRALTTSDTRGRVEGCSWTQIRAVAKALYNCFAGYWPWISGSTIWYMFFLSLNRGRACKQNTTISFNFFSSHGHGKSIAVQKLKLLQQLLGWLKDKSQSHLE